MTDQEFAEWVDQHEKQFTAVDRLQRVCRGGWNVGDVIYFTEPVPHPSAPPTAFYVPYDRADERTRHARKTGRVDPGGEWHESREFMRQWSIQQIVLGDNTGGLVPGSWRVTWGWHGTPFDKFAGCVTTELKAALAQVRQFRETELAPPGV